MSTRKPYDILSRAVAVYLVFLSLIFGYAVYHSGGTQPADWNWCMVGLGLLVLFYFRTAERQDLAPPLEWRYWWTMGLMLGFVGFQLVPLPAALLQAVSPVRAELLAGLAPVAPAASAPVSIFPSATLAHLLRIASYLVVFLLVRELSWRAADRRWIIAAPIVVVAACEAALGLLEYDGAASVFSKGTYANQNHFAGLLELSLPFAVMYPVAALTTQRRATRTAVLASLGILSATLILAGIILSVSRMALAASVTALFTVTFLTLAVRGPATRKLTVAGIIAACLLLTTAFLVPDTLIVRVGQVLGSQDMPPDARAQLWADAWRLASDYPLVGSGLGTFEQAFPKYKTLTPGIAVDFAHNDYLQLLVELGWIGVTIAALVSMVVISAAVRAIFTRTGSSARYLAIAALGSFVAILLHSMTSFNLYIPANAMLVAWIAGISASLHFDRRKDTSAGS
jgi:O-antigen ligase